MTAARSSTLDIRPHDTRFRTDLGWLDSRHSFSFGAHHDPANVGHGLLVVSNDDVVAPGRGFGAHSHRDMEIVSWVLDGALEHADSEGNRGVIRPGLIQRMSAGTGITHSEANASVEVPVRFLQMWIVPDRIGVSPSYEEVDTADRLVSGRLVTVASGRGEPGAVALHQAGAEMLVGRLEAGDDVVVPAAPFAHVYVARGSVVVDEARLQEGDALRLTDSLDRTLRAATASELVVWVMDAATR